MKNNRLIRKFFIFLVLAIGPMQLAQAETGGGIIITGLTEEVIKALSNMYANFYNTALENYKDLAYEFDPQIPVTVVSNNSQNTANTAVDKTMQAQSSALVSSDFSGIREKTQQQLSLLTQPGEDDAIEGATSRGLFSGGGDAFKDENAKAKAGNVAFNVESLLGTDTYSDQNARNSAQAFLAQIENLAPPPPVIRLAPKFDVPITNPNDPDQDTATVGDKKPLSADDLKKMQDALNQDKGYRDYKTGYRGIVAARSLYLNNLLRAYQERVPQVNGKSALQIRNERVNGRLTQDYYDKMSKASPSTVARETLFVLAEISSQINALQKQQDIMIEMNSISGLNTLVLGSNMLNAQAKDIGQMLYCMDPGHRKDKLCVAPEGAGPDIGAVTDQDQTAPQKGRRARPSTGDQTKGLKSLLSGIPGVSE